MRLRLTGTRAECDRFVAELVAATAPGVIGEVSGFYPDRESSVLGRVYLDLVLPDVPSSSAAGEATTVPAPRPAPRATGTGGHAPGRRRRGDRGWSR